MTASTADYYGILGLTSDATLADVKKAYRKLARQHPQRWTIHTTGTLTKILLIQTTPVTHLRGWYGERRPRPRHWGTKDPGPHSPAVRRAVTFHLGR